jgi:hypothetical protein
MAMRLQLSAHQIDSGMNTTRHSMASQGSIVRLASAEAHRPQLGRFEYPVFVELRHFREAAFGFDPVSPTRE